MAVETATFSGAVVYGRTTSQEETQGARIGTFAAVVVYGPAPPGTSRADLLHNVAHLPVSSISQTGTTKQGDVPVDRPDNELTTGEMTTVEQITVSWSSGPTTADLVAFNRTPLASPNFDVTHA